MTTEELAILDQVEPPAIKEKPSLVKEDGTPTPAGWHFLQNKLSQPMDSKKRQGRGGMQFDYITARQVQDRLDECVGPGNWSTEYRLLHHNADRNIVVVECRLTIFNVTKADSGTNNNPDIDRYVPCKQSDYGAYTNEEGQSVKKNPAWEDEPFKAAYSDALKRAAVAWGVGRWLYND